MGKFGPGVNDSKDLEAKATYGKFYEALRKVISDDDLVRPWEDLSPSVQFMFVTMVASRDNAANVAVLTLASFMGFCNSQMGEDTAEELASQLG